MHHTTHEQLWEHDYGARGRLVRAAEGLSPQGSWAGAGVPKAASTHGEAAVMAQDAWRLRAGPRPLLAAVVLCVGLLGGWAVCHCQAWLAHSLSPASIPEHVRARKLLVAERMPEREQRPLFAFDEYCGAQLRPQLSFFSLFAALPIIYERCPDQTPAVAPPAPPR
jgi:hypothetical protein